MKRGYSKILRNAIMLFILPLGSVLSVAYLAYHGSVKGYMSFRNLMSDITGVNN